MKQNDFSFKTPIFLITKFHLPSSLILTLFVFSAKDVEGGGRCNYDMYVRVVVVVPQFRVTR